MQSCFSKFTRAPIEYINQIRKLKTGSISMKGTDFYPAFPLSLLSSILCICGLSTYMIYYFFAVDQSICFSHILYGIIALAFLYPVQSILIYIILFGSVALSTSKCWKVFSIIFFGLLVTGFSFGGLGFAFLCTIDVVHPLLIPSSFLSSNTFIQVIVYCYISFIALYIVLLPALTFSYNQSKPPTNPNPNQRPTCYDRFCCCIYYSCQFLFLVTAIFMICIKLLGPPLLIYVLIQAARAGFYNQLGNLAAFFSLAILSICLPFFTFVVAYLIANYACKNNKSQQHQSAQPQTNRPANSNMIKDENKNKNEGVQMNTMNGQARQFKDESYQTNNTQANQGAYETKQRKSVFLENGEGKHFGQDNENVGTGIRNNLL